jgi:hypothetical protein
MAAISTAPTKWCMTSTVYYLSSRQGMCYTDTAGPKTCGLSFQRSRRHQHARHFHFSGLSRKTSVISWYRGLRPGGFDAAIRYLQHAQTIFSEEASRARRSDHDQSA